MISAFFVWKQRLEAASASDILYLFGQGNYMSGKSQGKVREL